MTVEKLIEELIKIKDKNAEVFLVGEYGACESLTKVEYSSKEKTVDLIP